MCDLVGRAFVDEEARFAVVDDAWDAAVSRADNGDEAGAGFFCDEDAAFAVAVSCDDAGAEEDVALRDAFEEGVLWDGAEE